VFSWPWPIYDPCWYGSVGQKSRLPYINYYDFNDNDENEEEEEENDDDNDDGDNQLIFGDDLDTGNEEYNDDDRWCLMMM